MSLEPWNSSTEKAKELHFADFGSYEAVQKMAKPLRSAENRLEAAKILKKIADNGELISEKGLTATLSSDSRGKIISSKALRTSYSQKIHYLAVANIDKLFYHAIEPWIFELNPNKNNPDLSLYSFTVSFLPIILPSYSSGAERYLLNAKSAFFLFG